VIRINLISGPRNISTALMYSFAQRSDTTVLDEPFYGVYLLKTGLPHPGREAVIATLPSSEKDVRMLINEQDWKPVLFIKNMAHHMETLETPWVNASVNVFLIRDPLGIIASYAKVIEKPVMRDIGLAYQLDLFKQLVASGKQPVVVDAGHLLQNPGAVLTQLCIACGIAFEESMLSWSAGAKPYDGVWATHWYGNVHRSNGFERPKTGSQPLTEGLETLYYEAKSIYEILLPFSLKA
jgi:hypothetical protein